MAHASDPISAPDKAPFEVRSAVMADGGGTNAPERHTWYDGLLAAGAAVAARWLNEHPAARAHVMRAYRYLSDRDVCLALLMVLGGALFFGRLRDLAYYGVEESSVFLEFIGGDTRPPEHPSRAALRDHPQSQRGGALRSVHRLRGAPAAQRDAVVAAARRGAGARCQVFRRCVDLDVRGEAAHRPAVAT
eukprot:ctg_4353.g672